MFSSRPEPSGTELLYTVALHDPLKRRICNTQYLHYENIITNFFNQCNDYFFSKLSRDHFVALLIYCSVIRKTPHSILLSVVFVKTSL